MSTTEDKRTAIEYCGAACGKPEAMVFVINITAVDRGARVMEFSQYPHEMEYIWPPLSYIQPAGPAYIELVDGIAVMMVPVTALSQHFFSREIRSHWQIAT